MATDIMTKGDEERVTTGSHKLSFDDYTGKFYFESKIEGIERTCKTRLKHVEAMNKGETLVMEGHHKQLEGKMAIFEMKNSREGDSLRDSLRDIVAHRNALEAVGRRKDADSTRNEMLGRYGMDCTRKDLLPLIELEKMKMDPSWRRRKECEVLLSQRKPMELIDRNLPTSRIYLSWGNKKSKGEGKGKPAAPRKEARLVLPPIKVKISPRRGVAKSVNGDVDADVAQEDPETTSLPSVFITQVSRPAQAQ